MGEKTEEQMDGLCCVWIEIGIDRLCSLLRLRTGFFSTCETKSSDGDGSSLQKSRLLEVGELSELSLPSDRSTKKDIAGGAGECASGSIETSREGDKSLSSLLPLFNIIIDLY